MLTEVTDLRNSSWYISENNSLRAGERVFCLSVRNTMFFMKHNLLKAVGQMADNGRGNILFCEMLSDAPERYAVMNLWTPDSFSFCVCIIPHCRNAVKVISAVKTGIFAWYRRILPIMKKDRSLAYCGKGRDRQRQ